MMKLLALIVASLLGLTPACAQTVNLTQQVTLQGLLSTNNHGRFLAAAYAQDGTLYLLLDQHDGIRLLKTDATATTLLAQSHQGDTGDSPVAMALDLSGNLYVTGTTTSASLTATSGAAFPSKLTNSTSSFLAKYDSNLNLLFLTFLGAPQTSATAIAATPEGPFVTGITYNQSFPVTPSGIEQFPAPNYSQNGFVEHFSADGATLLYATYLNAPAGGDVTPTGIAADTANNAYITGSTDATGFPTLNALVPAILGQTSGFLTALNPTGSTFNYSTFIPGTGLTSITLDPATQTLLLTGNITPGQFPIATITTPLASTPYQTLLRLPLDAQSITASTLLMPGATSFATPGPNGAVWITGNLTTPLFPGSPAPDYPTGDTFLLHLTANNTVDQTLRLGGLPIDNPNLANLTTTPAASAISSTGTLALPATLTTIADASLLTTQHYDFPLIQSPNPVLPNTLADLLPITCTNSSQCTGTAALLSLINPTISAPSLSLSAQDLPNITLRNQGSVTATGITLTSTGYIITTDCASTLAPSTSCTLALTGTGPGTLTVSAANAPTETLNLPATTLTPSPIALSATEIDFGILTSTDPAVTKTLTLTNLTATDQPFISQLDGPTTPYSFTETATTCGSLTTQILPASSTCTLTFAFTASTASDTSAANFWKIGTRDIKLTGFSQVAALNLSSTEIDFGTQFSNTPSLNLPRFLYLSNNSTTPIAHTPASLPTNSPFTLTDNCPTTLEPHTVCRLALTYLSPTAPSDDATTLTLDNNLSVLITGQTLAPTGVTGATANPSLTVDQTSLTFATPVTVTGISATTQTINLTNSGSTPFALTPSITGDFTLNNLCPATLSANASCQLIVSFAPSQPGQRQGLLSLATGSSFTPTLIPLTGTGSAILPANNGTLTLNQTYVGEPTILWLPVQQSLPSLTAASNSPLFTVALVPNTGATPTTLPQSSFTPTATSSCSNCYLGIQFLSQSPGPQSGTLTLTTVAAGNPYLLTLTATALLIQGLLLTPITQDFGPIPVHSTSPPITFTLANLLPSSSGATITSVTVTGDFTLAPSTTGGPSCTGALAPTASCYLQLTFTPTTTGARTGLLTITTDTGTLTAALTGYGNPDTGLSLSPTALTFDNVPHPTATTQTITLTNTGSTALTIATPTTSATNFTPNSTCQTLAPSITCTIAIQFTPTNAPSNATLSIPVTTIENGQSQTTTYTVPLAGSYTTEDTGLQILPSQVNFGSTPTNQQGYTREFTLNNLTAKQLAVTLSMPRQFPLANATACTTLAPSSSCTFSLTFFPALNGSLTGTVFAQGTPTDNTASVQALAYMLGYGEGVGTLTLTGNLIPNSPLNFGQLTSGQTTQQTLTLTNTGSSTTTIHRITSEPPFLASTTCTQPLAPADTCTVTLTYAPINELPTTSTNNTARTDNGTLIVESDAATSPTLLDLTAQAAPILSTNPASSSVLSTCQLSQQSLTFPNTAVGSASPTQSITLTNTGTTLLHILSITPSPDFTATTACATLAPGNACTLAVQFTPTPASTSTVRPGTLHLLTDAATPLDFITLVGVSSAAPLTLAPATLDFGAVNVGASGQLPLTVTNTTGAPITFNSITTIGDYTTTRNTCPANTSTLAANATCTLLVTFTPTAAGARTGTLSLSTDATTLPLTVSLTGTGAIGKLQITPGALAFGSIDIGSPAQLGLSIINNGTAPVGNIASTITGPNAADFAVTAPCSIPTLAANQGCTVGVTFTPSTAGARTAILTLTSSDPNGPAIIPLTGTGVLSGSFTLTVGGSTSQTQALTVTSGSPAVYNLTLSPIGSFTGTVALTCAPTIPAQYASCSLLSSTLTLTGSGVQGSTATINTITSLATNRPIEWLALLLTPLAFIPRRKRRTLVALYLFGLIALSGCGGGAPTGAGNGKLRYTPAGAYQYKVTASSTSGTAITSTVTLTLIVQ